jgi:putative nucleotidyltransferase with HDIG domain
MTDFFIIKNNKMLINWETVFNIDEFKMLKSIPQNPKWHFENFVSVHTMYTVNNALAIFGNSSDNYLHRIMVLAALFHDIGKGETTIFNKEKKSWSSPEHAKVGEEITRQLLTLWKYPPTIIEQICFFVKNHMKILTLYDSNEIVDELKSIASERLDGICTIENLIKLKQCDCLASIMLEEDGWQEKLEHIKKIAIQEKCFN